MTQTADIGTLEDLRARREEILRIAAAHDASNVRVFGAVARGEASEKSRVEFLVDIVRRLMAGPISGCLRTCGAH